MEITIKIAPSLKKHLVETYANDKMGARPLKRAIQTVVEDALSEKILSDEIRSGQTVTIAYRSGKVTFEAA